MTNFLFIIDNYHTTISKNLIKTLNKRFFNEYMVERVLQQSCSETICQTGHFMRLLRIIVNKDIM